MSEYTTGELLGANPTTDKEIKEGFDSASDRGAYILASADFLNLFKCCGNMKMDVYLDVDTIDQSQRQLTRSIALCKECGHILTVDDEMLDQEDLDNIVSGLVE